MSRWLPGQSGNPSGRRATGERIRKYLESYDEALIGTAVELALFGDVQLLAALLARLSPVPKPTSDPVEIPGLTEATTLTAKAAVILDAVGSGALSPDTATTLLSAIASVSKVTADEVLHDRIAALETKLGVSVA